MNVSARWAQVAGLTFLIGFTVLGYLAYAAYRGQQYDRLAAVIRESFDMAAVYEMMGIDGNRMTDSRKEDSE